MKTSRTRVFLAYVITTVFTTALFALFFRQIPIENKELITYMLGQLSGFLGAIVSFDFGSSRGSEYKSELLNEAREVAVSSTQPIAVKEPTDELLLRSAFENKPSGSDPSVS